MKMERVRRKKMSQRTKMKRNRKRTRRRPNRRMSPMKMILTGTETMMSLVLKKKITNKHKRRRPDS